MRGAFVSLNGFSLHVVVVIASRSKMGVNPTPSLILAILIPQGGGGSRFEGVDLKGGWED